MNTFTDFNDKSHRVISATATFQKGIYQLFMLKKQKDLDTFAFILRLYQCLFLLSVTELLLDFNYVLDPKTFARRREYLQKYGELSRKIIDPAALVQHSVFENDSGKDVWKGFEESTHALYKVSKDTLALYKKIVQARHNLIYRPFMLDKRGTNHYFWQDCDLMDLLEDVPETENIEKVYNNFYQAITNWSAIEQSEGKPGHASAFRGDLFGVYEDQRDNRPTETLLLTYARLLNPNNLAIIEAIRNYRNQLLGFDFPI